MTQLLSNVVKQMTAVVALAAFVVLGSTLMASAAFAADTHLNVNYLAQPSASPGELVAYQVNITNTGADKSTNTILFVNFEDIMPKNTLTFVPALSDSHCAMGAIPHNPNARGVVCQIPDVESGNGKSAHIVMTFRVNEEVPCGTTIHTMVDVDADGIDQPIWLSHALEIKNCPTATPTPTSTPEATPTPKKDESSELEVQKTDNHELIRPTNTLTYVITLKNKGNTDLLDTKIVDTLPSHLTIIDISNSGKKLGNKITWTNFHIGAGETKEVWYKAVVNADTPNGFILNNKVTAKSDDRNVHDEASDITKVERKGEVMATIAPVAVHPTAPTGAEAAIPAVVSTLVGAAGLALSIRKGVK